MSHRMPSELTIAHAQENQPWVVPYSEGVVRASQGDVPHILASHCALHAAKSVGKLAAVFESLDHSGNDSPDADQLAVIAGMSADLVTAALRFANLFGFDLASALVSRLKEKNGIDILGGTHE